MMNRMKDWVMGLSLGKKLSGVGQQAVDAILKEKVMGLDIGADGVKAVQLTRTKGGVRLLKTFQGEVSEGEGEGRKEALSRVLRELFDEMGETESIVSSLGLSSVIVRNLTLPFKDISKIRQMIKFEAEPYLPFPLERAMVDFYVIDEGKPQGTDVVMVAVNKEAVGEHVDTLAMAGMEPQIVSLDAMALFNTYCGEGRKRENEKPVALIDIGARRTLVAIISEGTLSFMRSIPRAGRTFTQAIAEELGVDFLEAEELKKEKGIILPEPGEDETGNRISQALRKTLSAWRKEVERTFLSFEAHSGGEEIGEIILSGGSSKLTNLTDYLSEELNVKVSFSNSHLPRGGDYVLEGKVTPSMNIALGLALSGLKRKRISLNFRREEMALRLEWSKLKRYLRPSIILIGMIIFLSLFSLFAQKISREKRYRRLNGEISRLVKETFPQAKNIPRGMEIAIMKNKVEEEEKRWELFRNLTKSYPSALETLRELHSRIPKGMNLDIYKFDIVGRTARIVEASTTSFEMVSELKKALEVSPYFEKVEVVSSVRAKGSGNLVKFGLKLRLREIVKSPSLNLSPLAGEERVKERSKK